jgi:hypothetical protein
VAGLAGEQATLMVEGVGRRVGPDQVPGAVRSLGPNAAAAPGVTFLDQGEVLGIRASLTQVVANADSSHPIPYDDIRKRVDDALSLSGGNLDSFFEIAQYLHALRGADANEKPEARKRTASALTKSLQDIEGLIDGIDPSKAWEKIHYFWNEADLTPKEIYLLLTVFHLFFYTLEDYKDAYEAWKEIVIKISKIKALNGRPPKLVSVLSVLAKIGAEDPYANAAQDQHARS